MSDDPVRQGVPVDDPVGSRRVLTEQQVEQLVQSNGGLVLVIEGRWRYHVDGCPTLADQDVEEGDVREIRQEGFTACPRCSPDQVLARAAAPVAPAPARDRSPAGGGATVLGHLGRLHVRQRAWPGLVRGLWWLLLLPLALACWSALQTSRDRQVAGWALAAVALLAYGGTALDPSSDSADQVVVASPQTLPPPSATAPAPVAPPAVGPATVTPSRAPATRTPVLPPRTASRPTVAPSTVQPRPRTPLAVRPTPRPTVQATRSPRAPAPARTSPPVTARTFSNCDDMHGTYPHGVGLPSARDRVRGNSTPVTTFERSAPLYRANSGSDRDDDGVACEA